MSQSSSVVHSRWSGISGLNAYCQTCPWQYEGDQFIEPRSESGRVLSAARSHVRKSGHMVRLERGQVSYLEPAVDPLLLSRETGSDD